MAAFQNATRGKSPESTVNGSQNLSGTESPPTAIETISQPPGSAVPPDGGMQAWLCVAGSAAGYFSTFGWINAVGVFQEYYQRVPLRNYSPSTVVWIATTENFFLLVAGPFAGNLLDSYGPTLPLCIGTGLHVFGLMMASLSTEFYQILLSQGICSAIGTGFIFNPAAVVVNLWFSRRRGLALLPKVGFAWAMRTCAFLVLGLMIFAIYAVRLPYKPAKRPITRALARRMLQPSFVLLTLSVFMFSLGAFLPVTYMAENATNRGLDVSLAQYMVSIYNAGALAGRLTPGIIGNKVGFFNLAAIAMAVTSILTLALWIPASTTPSLIAFAVLFGWSSNALIGLLPVLIGAVSDPRELGLRGGVCYGLIAFSTLAGLPIGSSLITNGNYDKMKIFSGAVVAGSALCLATARVSVGGLRFWKRV
ncbi:major facilitator superfamily transporter [Fusarium oxysporum II5]|nr:major facilitator superfamily transporter [Fusarium oxysporum II5]